MRGDSVRDLYAKALALIGLAVLAGAGALVDYWPVQNGLPDVSFAFALPVVPAPLQVDQVAAALPLIVRTAPRVIPVSHAPVTFAPPAPALEPTIPTVTVPADQPVAAPVAAAQAPDPAPAPDVVASAADAPAMGVSDYGSLPEDFPSSARFSQTTGDAAAAPPGNVLHRAGGGILNVGFAVGTGLAKSFQAVGSAFGHIGKLFAR